MEKQRLAGIDLVRGLAIYGVIILHADQGVRIRPDSWLTIQQVSFFAVPFFLAASFYLTAGKFYLDKKPYWLQARCIRVLIPYIFWSLFYLLFRSLKYLVANDHERVRQLFQDPTSIFFFGSAEPHLYFLPLLLAGTLVMKLAEFLVRNKTSLKLLLVLTASSLLLYELVILTGNGFDVPARMAFQPLTKLLLLGNEQNPLLRVFFVELAWMIRCLPYVLVAAILNHPTISFYLSKILSHHIVIWLLAFLGVNSLGNMFLPHSIHDIASGYTALLLALACSNYLKENFLLKSLGYCSFGIYLIHYLFVDISQSLMIRLNPGYIDHVSTTTLVAISIAIFLVSWGATALLIKHKTVRRVLV